MSLTDSLLVPFVIPAASKQTVSHSTVVFAAAWFRNAKAMSPLASGLDHILVQFDWQG